MSTFQNKPSKVLPESWQQTVGKAVVAVPEVEQQRGDSGLLSLVEGRHVVQQVALQGQQAVCNDGVQLHAATPAGHGHHRLLHCSGQAGHLQSLQQGPELLVC